MRPLIPSKSCFFTTATAAASLLFSCIAAQANTTGDLLKQGDVHDAKLQAAEALGYYQQIEKTEPNNPRVLVRIARQYRHLMADASSQEEKIKLGNISLKYGKKAAAVAPTDSEAQLSPAISYGKMLPLLGTKEQMAASKQIKDAADKAIKLDPSNDLAWHIEGRWHRVLADVSPLKRTLASIFYEKLPEASTAEAVRCFTKAIAINPNRLMHHIELGRAYAQAGQSTEAKKAIQKGLSMPAVEKDDHDFKAHGRETLAKLP